MKKNLIYNSCHIVFFSFIYIVFLFPFLTDNSFYPARDSINYHLVNFLYFSNSLLHGFGFPVWYPFDGGIPVGVTSIQLFSFLPYRLFGYALYSLLPLEPVTAYKSTLVMGMLIFSIGWWYFLYHYLHTRIGATFGVLMVLLGGVGITIFHQEQILATLTWIPWILLSLIQFKKNHAYIYILATVLGCSMTVHYPQIQILFLFFVLFALITSENIGALWKTIKSQKRVTIWITLVAALGLFILAALPSHYINKEKDHYASPLRKSEDIEVASFQKYIELNQQQLSSAPFEYFLNYVNPQVSKNPDKFLFFVTIPGLILSFIGVIFGFKFSRPILLILFLSSWAALGINGYFAQILYLLKFPFIKYFRQWYHFAPLINLCISALGALGIKSILSFLTKRKNALNLKFNYILIGGLLAGVFFLIYSEATLYLYSYKDNNFNRNIPKIQRVTKNEFIKNIRATTAQDGLEVAVVPLIMDKNRFKLFSVCKNNKYTTPFLTNYFYNDITLNSDRKGEMLTFFCRSKWPKTAAMVSIPNGVVNNNLLRLHEIKDLDKDFVDFQENQFPLIDDIIRLGRIITTPDHNKTQWINASNLIINGRNKRILFEHPPSKIEFPVIIPSKSSLDFSLGLVPESWDPQKGDGVLFEIYVKTHFKQYKIFSKYIDPKNNIKDRKWHDFSIDLDNYSEKKTALTFVTFPGRDGKKDNTCDWAVWGNIAIRKSNMIATSESFIEPEDYTYTPRGGFWDVVSLADSLAVLPFNYNLHLRVFQNHQPIETYSVFNGAMTGFVVPKGKYHIEFNVPKSEYQIELILQPILICGSLFFLLYILKKEKSHNVR